MTPCIIRPATDTDAEPAVKVLRRSIVEACVADHQNDAATLERWLRNKTPVRFRIWLSDPDIFMAVALAQETLCGVGAIRKSGDLDLCYVHPAWQRRGVGRALLFALEAQGQQWGVRTLRLISTVTARAFYEQHGYVFPPEESAPGYGILYDYRYAKRLP